MEAVLNMEELDLLILNKIFKKDEYLFRIREAKYEISRFILELNKKIFPFIILRPYIIYGPGQTRDRLIHKQLFLV